MNRTALALTAALVTAGTAAATPFEPRRIPADADGVGHLDLDALRKTSSYTSLGLDKKIRDELGKLPVAADRWFLAAEGLSFWVDDAHASGGDTTGAVLVSFPRNSRAPQDIVAALVKAAKGKQLAAGQYELQRDGDKVVLAVAGDAVVFASDPASLRKTLAVADGKAASLATKALPPSINEKGVFVFAALDDSLLEQVKKAAESALFKTEMKSLTFDVAEIGADLRGRAIATMATADQAQKVKAVIDGLLALAALADEAKPFLPFDRFIKVAVDKTTVTATLKVPVAQLVDLLRARTP